MYTKYNYKYTSTIEKLLLYHTLIQVCIINKITVNEYNRNIDIVSYSYTSMYTKFNYKYTSTI